MLHALTVLILHPIHSLVQDQCNDNNVVEELDDSILQSQAANRNPTSDGCDTVLDGTNGQSQF